MKPSEADDELSDFLTEWRTEVGVCVYQLARRRWLRMQFGVASFDVAILANATIVRPNSIDFGLLGETLGVTLLEFPVYSVQSLSWFSLSPTGRIKHLPEAAKAIRDRELTTTEADLSGFKAHIIDWTWTGGIDWADSDSPHGSWQYSRY